MDIQSVVVAGAPSAHASYIHELRAVELYDEYVLDAQTTPDSIACTLVHEAQHARLYRLGFGYDKAIGVRIEKLCFRAQRNFARLLPDGEKLVAEAEAWMEADPEVFSNEARRGRELQALRDLGCPEWFVKIMAWIARRRAA